MTIMDIILPASIALITYCAVLVVIMKKVICFYDSSELTKLLIEYDHFDTMDEIDDVIIPEVSKTIAQVRILAMSLFVFLLSESFQVSQPITDVVSLFISPVALLLLSLLFLVVCHRKIWRDFDSIYHLPLFSHEMNLIYKKYEISDDKKPDKPM